MSTNVTEQVTHLVNIASHASLLTYAAIGVGVFMAAFLFKLFFQDFTDFRDCVRPDIISWVKGESVEDAWSEMKLFVWAALATGSGILAYHQLPGGFPGFFGR